MYPKDNEVTIIYDGECPFCSDFVSLNRLRSLGYVVNIVNARDNDNQLVRIFGEKYNLDDGMIVLHANKVLYGASAARFIARSYSYTKIRAMVYRAILGNKKVAAVSYGALVKLRRLFFKIIGKSLINEDS